MRLTLTFYAALLALVVGLGLFLWGRAAGVSAVKPRLESARAEVRSAQMSATGEQASGRRAVAQARIAYQAAQVAAEVAVELSNSETAHAPLDADRRDRLRRADQRLCKLNPQLGGCRAADRNASGRPRGL